jgi:hypothetical protein
MGGVFSGNGSVTWVVEGDNVQETDSILYPPDRDRPRRFRHHGVDRTDAGQFFTIVLKLPRVDAERKRFLEELRDAADKATTTISVRLPIEDVQHNAPDPATADQIQILWPSSRRPVPGS